MGYKAMKRLPWVLLIPSAAFLSIFALVAGVMAYSQAYNNAFSKCEALTMVADPGRSEFDSRWVPPGFECVLYDEDGAEILRVRD